MNRALVWTFVNAALLLGPLSAAHAGDMDGVWERDDKRVYRIVEADGIAEGAGEFGCRLHWTRTDDQRLAFSLRFTKRADESGWLATTATSTAVFEAEIPDKVELDFAWVDLDPKGKVLGRGTERHTLRRTRKLTDEELTSATARLAWHARIDGYLTGSPEYASTPPAMPSVRVLADEALKEGTTRSCSSVRRRSRRPARSEVRPRRPRACPRSSS